MFPGINPRKMQQMMRQMGIQQVDIPATEVIIRTKEKDIIITNPSVAKVNMMGQETFQVSGEIHEKEPDTSPEISKEDIETVMKQTGAEEDTARNALKEAEGNLAEAIINLQKSDE